MSPAETALQWSPAALASGDDAGANLVVRQASLVAGVHRAGRADNLPDAWGVLVLERVLRARGVDPGRVRGYFGWAMDVRSALDGDGDVDLPVGAPQAGVGGGAWLFTGPLDAGALDDTTGCAAVFSDTSVDAGIGGSVGLVDLDNDGLAEVLTGGAILSGYGGGGVAIYSPEGL